MRVAIGLGSNLGDRLGILQRAVVGLAGMGQVVAVSSLYRSDPVGGPDQPDFLNAAVVIDTDLDLFGVLMACQEIERAAGRVREERWGPRTLDLDILSATAPPVATDQMTVPHPRLAERRFALEPLAEIWSDASTGSGTARAGRQRVADQSVELLVAPGWEDGLSRGGGWVVMQVLLLGLVTVGALATPGHYDFDGRWPGRTLIVAGLVLAGWAMRTLGASLTPYPQPRHGAAMVSAGPYGLVRHPIYGGIIIVLAGVAVHEMSLIGGVGVAVVGLFFWFKSSFEERRLFVAHSRYRQYRRTVAKRLIPFVV